MGSARATEVMDLSRADCLQRLRYATFGRLAVSHKALPFIVPVRIAVHGVVVEVWSLLGSSVPLRERSVVALEVGTMGDGSTDEWAVEVTGVLEPATGSFAALSGRAEGAGPMLISVELVRGWQRSDTHAPY